MAQDEAGDGVGTGKLGENGHIGRVACLCFFARFKPAFNKKHILQLFGRRQVELVSDNFPCFRLNPFNIGAKFGPVGP